MVITAVSFLWPRWLWRNATEAPVFKMYYQLLYIPNQPASGTVVCFDFKTETDNRIDRIVRRTDRQTGRQTGRQTCRQTDRQTGRQADRQADKQTNSKRFSANHAHQYERQIDVVFLCVRARHKWSLAS